MIFEKTVNDFGENGRTSTSDSRTIATDSFSNFLFIVNELTCAIIKQINRSDAGGGVCAVKKI